MSTLEDSQLGSSGANEPVPSLQDAVSAVFAPHGPLADAADTAGTFCPRDGQTRMAQAVARVVEKGGVLVAEAATGVGKTFAYLVPALLSGERVLLSTATKTLQDQLFGRDLPALARRRLHMLGLGQAQIYGNDSSAAWCTASNPSRFFSHRRDTAVNGCNGFGTTGRMAACIWKT